MRIGVPKEIKTQEFRVGMTPSGVATLVARGHQVSVEQGAGQGSAIPDEAYVKAGAKIVPTKEQIWGDNDMVVKVKEPIPTEYSLLRKDLLLFTYLHLAAAPELGKEMISRGVNGVAYETIEPTPGDLPLLTPMSAVAGRMAVQAGATYLEREKGGKGVLLGGVPGARAPRLVTTAMIKQMEPGSVIVDVSIDQGGCVEGARATYHDNPTYDLHGVTAYMVANMPGAVPRTSTYALTNATIKYAVALADNGLEKAVAAVPHIMSGINTYKGTIPHAAVAEALNVPHVPFKA